MDIALTGRNLELDRDIKMYVRKRLKKAEKIYKRIYQCDVILEREKDHVNVEIIVYLKRNKLVAKETSQDVFTSIDMASHNMARQLRRLRGKLSARRRREVMKMISSPVAAFSGGSGTDELSGVGEIIEVDTFAEKPMLPEEAKEELNLKGWDFILFSNAETNQTNLLYRRKDGRFGLVEPRF